jgi:threonylcarbamoyladenosine tRNA methylthiotransferase MtaB
MTVTKVAFHTLGCKLNYAETSTLSRMLEGEGFEKAAFEDVADVYIINTCSVTENADKECRYLVRKIQRQAPEAFVVITGCYAQLKPEEIAGIEGVDLVLGAAEKFELPRHLRDLSKSRTGTAQICSCDIDEVSGFHSSFSLADRTRTFLKVQDGCDYSCSFCTIPLARGKSRSDSIKNVAAQVQSLAGQGVKEIVLTGINLGDFGEAGEDFLQLIKTLDKVDGIERYRISSIEPNLLSKEIIEFVAGSQKVMPHFHIPLQSGSNRILGLMRRRYRRELYTERVAMIKEAMPHCAIGADVIVGFPGETEAEFMETHEFLRELPVSYLHVFTYSERANTLAATMERKVPVHLRNERNKMLRNLSYKKLTAFTEGHRGQERPVLWEKAPINGMMEGYTDNYIKLSVPFNAEWANSIKNWKI